MLFYFISNKYVDINILAYFINQWTINFLKQTDIYIYLHYQYIKLTIYNIKIFNYFNINFII